MWWLLLVLAVTVSACGDAAGSAAGDRKAVEAQAGSSEGRLADPTECERLSRRLEGRRLAEAEAMARSAGCRLRVVVRDGERLAVTQDFNPSRINVHVRKSRVSAVAGLF